MCTSQLSSAHFSPPLMPPPSQNSPVPHPEAGAVCVGPNEAETVARNILASHSKGDDGGGVPGQKVLGGEVVELD